MGAIDRTRIGPRPTGASSGAAGDLATHEARRTFPAAGRAGLASFARGGHHGGMRRALPELAIAVSLTAPALAHGQAPAEQTFGAWLKRQPAGRQDEVLGATRGALFRRGGLEIEQFANDKGRWLTLDQLRERDAAAFRRAGVE